MQLWVGLAGVKPNPQCKEFRRFGEGKGAYIHSAAWAESQAAFGERIKRAVEELDCILCEWDDVSLLEARLEGDDYPEEFLDMRTTAVDNPDDTVFGTFHIWLQNDDN